MNCNTCKKLIPADSEFCPFCGNKIIHIVAENSENSTLLHSYQPDALLKRAFLFIEEMRFDKADAYIEEVLNQDPENAEAYLAKLLMDFKASDLDELSKIGQPFDNNINYKRAFRYGNEALKQRLLDAKEENAIAILKREEQELILEEENIEALYQQAKHLISGAEKEDFNKAIQDLEVALALLSEILYYKDSADLHGECEQAISYNIACKKMHSTSLYDIEEAVKIFEEIIDYKDSKDLIEYCKKCINQIKNDNLGPFEICILLLILAFFIFAIGTSIAAA